MKKTYKQYTNILQLQFAHMYAIMKIGLFSCFCLSICTSFLAACSIHFCIRCANFATNSYFECCVRPSLVPRLSHHPFFYTCSMQSGGGKPGPCYLVNDVTVYLGRQRWGGVPDQKNELEALSCSFCSIRFVSNVCEAKHVTPWFKTRNMCVKCVLSIRGPFPPVYLGDTDVVYVIKWTRPSPSILHTASNPKLDGGKAWEQS